MSRDHHRPSNAEPLSIEGTQMLWSCSLIEMPPDDCSATDRWPIKRLADLLRLWKMPWRSSSMPPAGQKDTSGREARLRACSDILKQRLLSRQPLTWIQVPMSLSAGRQNVL